MNRPLVSHLLFWVLFLNVALVYNAFSHGVLTLSAYLQQFTDIYIYEEYGRTIITFYISLWVFTHHFYPKNLPVIFLQIVTLGLADAVLAYVIDHQIIGPLTDHWVIERKATLAEYLSRDISSSWLYVMLAFVFKHLQDHYRSEAVLHEKNAIELAYLKSQLNPHFLFNSMNNLYGLSLTEPARTPDAILKLSELMRYMLYESNAPLVALSHELDYLTSYIALEKLRHATDQFHVNFRVEGHVNGQLIAPLLLIAFVENAFKHGEVGNAAQPIELRLHARHNGVSFSTQNLVAVKNKDQVGGVGLAGVRRRLALLYPGRHRLAVSAEAGMFRTELEVET
ncbi:MAG TPA: histidine kinase [Hymenobacter sp.]|jgi:LytS/YehU family sensor histidine kinase